MTSQSNLQYSRWIITLVALVFLAGLPLAAQTGPSKPALSALYPPETVREILLPRPAWHPYPTLSEREFWGGLPEAARQTLTAKAEKALGQPWPALPASLYLEYSRNGNRVDYEDPYFERRERLGNLVLGECVEAKGRFTDEIVNGLWTILEESSWVLPAHLGAQKAGSGLPDTGEPVVDLFSAETVSLLAWTYYLLGPQLDKVSPLITQRIVREARARVLTPCLERDDFWWMAFNTESHINNWNPWCNSNWLTAALLLEDNEQKRCAAVAKIMRSLDRFIGSYKPDGGCDEGPGYWGRAGASLFDCLELLKSASGGKIDIYDQDLIRQMGRYIYRAHIYDRYFIDFADAAPKMDLPDDLVYRFGKRIGDANMCALGAWFARRRMETKPEDGGSLGRELPALAELKELAAAPASQPLVRDVWLDGIQVMAARYKAASPAGLYLAAKGGNNAESHNHNDVGNFIVYVEGRPALIDAGVGTYTRKTFSDQRYDIWTMQSAYHNLPTVNGVMQKDGPQFSARSVRYRMDNSMAELSMDIAGAYPDGAGVKTWNRTLRLARGKEARITDSFLLTKREGELSLNLMTPCTVVLAKKGQLTLKENGSEKAPFTVRLLYDANKLTPTLDRMEMDDARLKSAWGESLTRIILRAAEDSPLKDTWDLRIVEE